jgi:signal transduction histidine kinase
MLNGEPNYHFGLFSFLNFSTFFLALVFSGILGMRKNKTQAKYLAFLFLSIAVWAGANTFENAASTPLSKEFWSVISYIGTGFAPLCFFMFSMQFSGRIRRENEWKFLTLGIIPLFYVAIAATNQIHHQLWTEIVIDPETNLGTYSHGLIFWGYLFYQYAILGIGIINLILYTVQDSRLVKSQLVILISGSVFPILGNVIYVFKLIPPTGFDWTPITFWVSSLLLTIGISKYRLFDIVPTARGQLIEEMGIGYIVTDAAKKVLDFNTATIRVLGIPDPTRFKGTSILDIITGLQDIDQKDDDSTATSPEKHIELPLKDKYIDIISKPILNTQGNVNGYLITLQDTTARKVAELSLDSYAHTVAHDLKNPLASMKGFLGLIEEELPGEIDSEIRNYVTYARHTAEDMQHIIDEFLILATLRTESFELKTMNMGSLVNRAITRLDHLIHNYDTRLILPESWPDAIGYGYWIEEVWANYVSNAIKYGGRPPMVQLGWDEDNTGKIRFWVMDNGPGISPDIAHRLFRYSPEREKTSMEVHGLGLSIVKRILDRLGSKAGFENIPTGGCRFYFTLPKS